MKACGVIAEYNPFHNGHRYQLAQARAKSQADVMVAVMSGNFLQRGEPAIVDKWQRAEAALTQGADLVIELPVTQAVQAADYFASGGIALLQALGVDYLSFGTDRDAGLDYHHFATQVAERQEEVDVRFQALKNNGMSYPQQLTHVYRELFPDWHLDFTSPNHILGMSYAKANQRYERPLTLLPIQREATAHHQNTIGHQQFASGSAIRQVALAADFAGLTGVVSAEMARTLATSTLVSWEQAWPYLKYQLITTTSADLRDIYQMVEGIEHRLQKAATQAQSFAEFIGLVKTKRFTWTRLQRLCTYVLLQLTQAEVAAAPAPNYLRVLGFNEVGREYLKQQGPTSPLPLITNIKRDNAALVAADLRAGEVYQLLSGSQSRQDYSRRPLYLKNKT